MKKTANEVVKKANNRAISIVKFLFFSALGVMMFFIDIEINGKSALMINHIKDLIEFLLGPAVPYYALAMICYGGIQPIVKGTYKKSKQDFIFTFFKTCGIPIGFMAVFSIGPEALLTPNMLPFLLNTVVISICLAIPAIGIGYIALLNYGFVEFLSTFLQPLMRKIWHTPGESAVDAIVSFTSSYAPAVILTNDFYKRGIYSAREAVIIATGFSTVAITFLTVVAGTLDLMDHWMLFFGSSLFVTFATTAITARIYPISKIPNDYYDKKAESTLDYSETMMKRAFKSAIDTAENAKPFSVLLKDFYLGSALNMTGAVTASILSIGLFGLVLAEFTPVFDMLGYIFYPVTILLGLPDPMLVAKASAIEIAEMFLPTMLVVGSDIMTRFVVGVTSVSAILFFSASIPCLTATDIPISMKNILLIWFERTVISLVLAAGIAHIFF